MEQGAELTFKKLKTPGLGERKGLQSKIVLFKKTIF